MTLLGVWAQATPEVLPAGADWGRSLLALAIVLGLLAALVFLLRRGALGPLGRQRQAGITVDAVVPLGDRRSLIVVSVEGRRLLLGASPVNVSLVTELGPRPSFDAALARSVGAGPEAQR